jgi:hypothetical protein
MVPTAAMDFVPVHTIGTVPHSCPSSTQDFWQPRSHDRSSSSHGRPIRLSSCKEGCCTLVLPGRLTAVLQMVARRAWILASYQMHI